MIMGESPRLPPFRLRQLRGDAAPPSIVSPLGSPSSAQGLVSMRRRSYDDLLASKPQAVLRYVDEDDGENITVGSGFELLQRLNEPLDQAIEHWSQPQDDIAMLTHTFDISDSDDVKRAWRNYTDRASPAPKPNLALSSRQLRERYVQDAELANLQNSANPTLDRPASNASNQDQADSLTPTGRRQAEQAAVALLRASQNSQQAQSAAQVEDTAHRNRWAAYGTIPGCFSPLPAGKPDRHQADPSSLSPAKETVANPLLTLFEAELARLASRPTECDAEPPVSIIDEEAESASRAATSSASAQTQPNYQSSQTQTTANASPRDLIGSSMRILFEGISLLASNSSDLNSELRQLALNAPTDFVDFIKSRLGRGAQAPADAVVAAQIAPARDNSQPSDQPLSTPSCRVASRREKADQLLAELSALLAASLDETDLPQKLGPSKSHATRSYPCMPQCTTPECSSSPPSNAQFVVERIVGRRYILYGSMLGIRKTQYLIRWVAHGPQDDVWYDEGNLDHIRSLVDQYDVERARTHPIYPTSWLDPSSREAIDKLHHETADRMIPCPLIPVDRERTASSAEVSSKPLMTTSSVVVNTMEASPLPSTIQSGPQQPQASATSCEERQEPTCAEPKSMQAPKRQLKHRRSWHPNSKPAKAEQDTNSFNFSPSAIMKKYPPIAFIAPEHDILDGESNDSTVKPRTSSNVAKGKSVKFQGQNESDTAHKHVEAYKSPEEQPWGPQLSSHQLDHTLYAPPSPTLNQFKLHTTPADQHQTSSKSGPADAYLRRVKSLTSKPPSSPFFAANTMPVSWMTKSSEAPRQGSLHRSKITAAVHPTARHAALASQPRPRSLHAHPSEAERRHRDNIAYCIVRLIEMGYGKSEATVVAESVSGDLETALDVMEEDVRARKDVERRISRTYSPWVGHSGPIMPGSFK